MASPPLSTVLGKVPAGDVEVHAPEWTSQGDSTLFARLLIVVLLLAFSVLMVFGALEGGADVNSQTSNSPIAKTFEKRATEASTAVAAALTARRSAKRAYNRARAEVQKAGKTPGDKLRQALVDARLKLRRARDLYNERVQERSFALEDLAALRSSTDAQIVRSVTYGVLAVIGVVGAGALLAPRRSQLLTLRPTPKDDDTDGTGGGTTGLAVKQLSAQAPAPTPTSGPEPAPGEKITAAEPAVVQGLVGSAALIAGLFGIQEFEGTRELLLNIALPLIPIVGALFVRSRVAARPNIRLAERRRLFSS